MPDWPLALPGTAGLVAAALVAGIVYGFAGFGAALIFMPVAARILPPAEAVGVLAITAAGSILTVVPGAWRAADLRATGITLAAAVVTLPLGVAVLMAGDPVALRWAVSLVVLVTLGCLVSGWRYSVTAGPAAWGAVGAGVGFLGGSTGLNGPPMVLFQLAGPDGVARSRANTVIVLSFSGVAVVPVLAAFGALPSGAAVVGLALLPVYAAGGRIGRAFFDPGRVRLYRGIAYAIVAVAGISGLPLWD